MDEAIDFAAVFEQFDTFVMGRKTWDVSATADVGGMGDMFSGKEVIVFSKTLKTRRARESPSSTPIPLKRSES